MPFKDPEKKKRYQREYARRRKSEDPSYGRKPAGYWKQYHVDHRDDRNRQLRESYARHSDKRIAEGSAYYRANKDRLLEYHKEYRKQNPDSGLRKSAARHAWMKHCSDPESLLQYVDILENDPCVYCGNKQEEIDHVDPRHLGGVHEWYNLTAACSACNSAKRTKPLIAYLACRAC